MARIAVSHPTSSDEPQGLEPLAVTTSHGLRMAQVCEPPARGPDSPEAALILGFHGGGGAAGRFAIRSGMAEAMLLKGQGTVFPQAEGHWADGRGNLEAGWPKDLEFMQQLIANSGARKLAVVGVSNGGMFALRLGCELEPPPAAVVAVSCAMPADYLTEAPAGAPVPVMLVGSPSDPIIPWGGGWMPRPDEDIPGGKFLSADETIAFWQRRNRVDRTVPPRTKSGFIGTIPVDIRCWSGAADVWQVVLNGAPHGWPARLPGMGLAGSLEDLVARFFAFYLEDER